MGKVPGEIILDLINKHLDFRPEAIIRTLDLRHPIYRQTATYGHLVEKTAAFLRRERIRTKP